MIWRACNPTASRDRIAPSTEDDERVQVHPAGAGDAQFDGVRAERGEGRGVHDDPAPAGGRAEAHGPAVDPIDVDAGTAAGGPDGRDHSDPPAAEAGPDAGAGARGVRRGPA